MAYDFPPSPNPGDTFTDPTTGAVYRWNGTAWVGGVPGSGLQSVKETRYLTAGSFTHTRDPKCNGTADVFLMGGAGARIVAAWSTGLVAISAQAGGGAMTIKYKYALGASCPVVVGAGAVSSGPGGASSFDTVLTANGGQSGAASNGANTAPNINAAGGAGGTAGATGDENYNGQAGDYIVILSGYLTYGQNRYVTFRDCVRMIPGSMASSSGNTTAAAGPPGVVVVREYLNA